MVLYPDDLHLVEVDDGNEVVHGMRVGVVVALDVDPGERAGQTTSLLVAVAPRRPRVHEHAVHVLDASLVQGLLKLGTLLAGRLALVELLEHYGRLDVRDLRPRGNGAPGQRDHGLVARPVVPVEDDREGLALEGIPVLEGEHVLLGRLVQGEAGKSVPRAEVAFLAHYADRLSHLLQGQRRQGMICQGGRSFCHSHDLLLSHRGLCAIISSTVPQSQPRGALADGCALWHASGAAGPARRRALVQASIERSFPDEEG